MMVKLTGAAPAIRPAVTEDRRALFALLHNEIYSHRHMDWKSPLDWLGHSPFYVALRYGQAAAMIACPPDPPEIAWIRAFATSALIDLDTAWEHLWGRARDAVRAIPSTERVLAVAMDDWFEDLLSRSGFKKHADVIMLSWENGIRQPPHPAREITVRPMRERDLPEVAAIDRAAFQPVWHNSLAMLSLAFQESLFATVSENEGRITGYQISTPSPLGGHLARLAVLPELQGQGIGYGLLYDLLIRFRANGALHVTVNTQDYNAASQKLYAKANFHVTGESYPVFEYPLY